MSVSMLWLRVDGYPAGCLEQADRLTAVADRLGDAAATLATRGSVSTDDFDGLAAAAFRTRAADLADATADSAADTRHLARALRELGRDLRDAETTMERLRGLARPHLRVLDDRILAPERPRSFMDPADIEAWAAWDVLLPIHADARALEARAQADWRAAVGTFTGGGRVPFVVPGVSVPVTYDPDIGPHQAVAG